MPAINLDKPLTSPIDPLAALLVQPGKADALKSFEDHFQRISTQSAAPSTPAPALTATNQPAPTAKPIDPPSASKPSEAPLQQEQEDTNPQDSTAAETSQVGTSASSPPTKSESKPPQEESSSESQPPHDAAANTAVASGGTTKTTESPKQGARAAKHGKAISAVNQLAAATTRPRKSTQAGKTPAHDADHAAVKAEASQVKETKERVNNALAPAVDAPSEAELGDHSQSLAKADAAKQVAVEVEVGTPTVQVDAKPAGAVASNELPVVAVAPTTTSVDMAEIPVTDKTDGTTPTRGNQPKKIAQAAAQNESKTTAGSTQRPESPTEANRFQLTAATTVGPANEVVGPSAAQSHDPTPNVVAQEPTIESATAPETTSGSVSNPTSSVEGTTSRGSARTNTTSSHADIERVRFVQRVSRALQTAGEGNGSLRLRLSPPELGAVRVEVTIKDGVMTARLEAETPAARAALLDSCIDLQQRLAEHDITLDSFEVELSERPGTGSPNEQSLGEGYAERQEQGVTPRAKVARPKSPTETQGSAAATRIVAVDQLNVII